MIARPNASGVARPSGIAALRTRAYCGPTILRLALVGSLLVASGAVRAQQSGLACAASTIGQYANAKIALYQGRSLFSSPSVDFTLRARRLKEDYCLRYARCLFSDSSGFASEQTFAGCVRDKD